MGESQDSPKSFLVPTRTCARSRPPLGSLETEGGQSLGHYWRFSVHAPLSLLATATVLGLFVPSIFNLLSDITDNRITLAIYRVLGMVVVPIVVARVA